LKACAGDEILQLAIRYLVGKIAHEKLFRHEILQKERRSPGTTLTFSFRLL
jgi:hypothetical protein